MTQRVVPARLHLLPAKEAPYVVIIRRKPARAFHVIRWNTATDEMEHGSWFNGKLYSFRSDVSFDGHWMVYLATGAKGKSWTGVCRLPKLTTIVDWSGWRTWFGGGYFTGPKELALNGRGPERGDAPKELPFRLVQGGTGDTSDFGVLFPKLERDGWQRAGTVGATVPEVIDGKWLYTCRSDLRWHCQPTPAHPTLRMYYTGYSGGEQFAFALDDHPDLLANDVQWACWDALGQLIVAREGKVERYTLANLAAGKPSFTYDLNPLKPVWDKATDER